MPERRRLVIVHVATGDRLTVEEDLTGLNWTAVNLPANFAAVRWWQANGWREDPWSAGRGDPWSA